MSDIIKIKKSESGYLKIGVGCIGFDHIKVQISKPSFGYNNMYPQVCLYISIKDEYEEHLKNMFNNYSHTIFRSLINTMISNYRDNDVFEVRSHAERFTSKIQCRGLRIASPKRKERCKEKLEKFLAYENICVVVEKYLNGLNESLGMFENEINDEFEKYVIGECTTYNKETIEFIDKHIDVAGYLNDHKLLTLKIQAVEERIREKRVEAMRGLVMYEPMVKGDKILLDKINEKLNEPTALKKT